MMAIHLGMRNAITPASAKAVTGKQKQADPKETRLKKSDETLYTAGEERWKTFNARIETGRVIRTSKCRSRDAAL